jgi:hypothetical protein
MILLSKTWEKKIKKMLIVGKTEDKNKPLPKVSLRIPLWIYEIKITPDIKIMLENGE